MKGKTISEKVLSRASGRDVRAGEFTWATPDLIYIHDITGPLAISALKRMSMGKPGFKGKIFFIFDHVFPPKDVQSAHNILSMKQYADDHNISYMKEGEGIEHTLFIENDTILPGMFVVGGDSHTVTAGSVGAMGIGLGSTDIAITIHYGKNWFLVPESIRVDVRGILRRFVTGKDIILELIGKLGIDGANYLSLEFSGGGMEKLEIDDRLAVSNMTAETGAKAGIVVPDEKIRRHYTTRGIGINPVIPDDDAKYVDEFFIDLDDLGPKIAVPFSPQNVKSVSDVEGVRINQVYIGNCANGTLSDLRQAAGVLKNRQINENVKMIVIPATRRIYREALDEGLIKIFIDSGATVGPPTCGACGGNHMGILGKDEVAISNTNRNYRGRMGDPTSNLYLANSYVAAASALEGYIVNPEESL